MVQLRNLVAPPCKQLGGCSNECTDRGSGGRTGLAAHIQLSAAHALAGSGTSVAVVAGLLSFVIGLGPLLFRQSLIFLVAGVALVLDCWVLGQSFGQIFTGMATDPNTGPLVILLALAIYPGAAQNAEAPAARGRSAGAISTRASTLTL